jgi:hypothetical protein
VHDDCGETIRPVAHCSVCGERLTRGRVHLEAGPGDRDAAFVGEGRLAR